MGPHIHCAQPGQVIDRRELSCRHRVAMQAGEASHDSGRGSSRSGRMPSTDCARSADSGILHGWQGQGVLSRRPVVRTSPAGTPRPCAVVPAGHRGRPWPRSMREPAAQAGSLPPDLHRDHACAARRVAVGRVYYRSEADPHPELRARQSARLRPARVSGPQLARAAGRRVRPYTLRAGERFLSPSAGGTSVEGEMIGLLESPTALGMPADRSPWPAGVPFV